MAHVTVDEINKWLEESRGQVVSITGEIAELEISAAEQAFSALRSRYDTASWMDVNTTPTLVRDVISALIAAWHWKTAFADTPSSENQRSFGDWLESRALALLGGLATGSSQLNTDAIETGGKPSFWPTDQATVDMEDSTEDLDVAPLSFRMNQVL